MYKKINKCRISNDKNLNIVFKPEKITLTGEFPSKQFKPTNKMPLEVAFSKKSGLLQLNHNYIEKKLFGDNYGYRSGLNKFMVYHLENKSKQLKNKLHFKKNDYILDIGSNDGTFLNFFPNKTLRFGVDPTSKKFKKYYNPKIKRISKLFNNNIFGSKFKKKFKLITALAMFYDLRDPISFCKNIDYLLDDNGIFHIEICYLPDIIKNFSFDTFCQEHLAYYSLHSFLYMLQQTNFKISDVGRNNINGGSIWLNLIKKSNNFVKIKKNKVNNLIKLEKKEKILSVKKYKIFFKEVNKNIRNIKKNIIKIKNNNKTIFGFGASTKGNAILQFCDLNYRHIDCILDVNKDKFNKYTPGTNIIIKNELILKEKKPDYIFLLVWHFKNSIKLKLKKYVYMGGKLLSPFPKIKIISKKNFNY